MQNLVPLYSYGNKLWNVLSDRSYVWIKFLSYIFFKAYMLHLETSQLLRNKKTVSSYWRTRSDRSNFSGCLIKGFKGLLIELLKEFIYNPSKNKIIYCDYIVSVWESWILLMWFYSEVSQMKLLSKTYLTYGKGPIVMSRW